MRDYQGVTFQVQEDDPMKPYYDELSVFDMDYWSKAAYWMPEEAIFLSFGMDYDPLVWQDMVEEYRNTSSLAKACLKVQRLLGRAIAYKEVASTKQVMDQSVYFDLVSPLSYIKWCILRGIPFPKELYNLVMDLTDSLDEEKQSAHNDKMGQLKAKNAELEREIAILTNIANTKDMDARRVKTLQKMVLGMAIKGYYYDPTLQKSDKIKDIGDDLGALFLDNSPTDETIRATLRDAEKALKYKHQVA